MNGMKLKYLLGAWGMAAAMVSCSHPNDKLIEDAPYISVTYTDDLGREISLGNEPKKIISLAPAVTEIMYAIGAEDKLIAVSQLCNYPPDATDLQPIQSFPQIHLASVESLEPDLVITSSDVHQEQVTDNFEKTKFPMYFLKSTELKHVYRNIRHIGELTGKVDEANFLADSLETIENRFRQATEGEIKYGTMVIMKVDSEIVVAGGEGMWNEMVNISGGKNVFADKKGAYAIVTPEEILQAKPEFIFLFNRDEKIYADLMKKHPILYLNMPASQNNQVFVIDPELVLRSGPRIMEGIATLTRSLHSRIDPQTLFDEAVN